MQNEYRNLSWIRCRFLLIFERFFDDFWDIFWIRIDVIIDTGTCSLKESLQRLVSFTCACRCIKADTSKSSKNWWVLQDFAKLTFADNASRHVKTLAKFWWKLDWKSIKIRSKFAQKSVWKSMSIRSQF